MAAGVPVAGHALVPFTCLWLAVAGLFLAGFQHGSATVPPDDARRVAELLVPHDLFVSEQVEIVRRIYADAARTSQDAILFEQQYPGLNAEVGEAIEPEVAVLASGQHREIVDALAGSLSAQLAPSDIGAVRAFLATEAGVALVRGTYAQLDLTAIAADAAERGAPSVDTLAAVGIRAREQALADLSAEAQAEVEEADRLSQGGLRRAQEAAMEVSRAYLTADDQTWESRLSLILMAAIEKAIESREAAGK